MSVSISDDEESAVVSWPVSSIRSGVAAVVAAALIATIGGSALADPEYPSDDDIEDAQEAEASVEDAIAAAEERLAALEAELDDLHVTVGLLVEAYNGAQIELAQAVEAEEAAAERVAESEAEMDSARAEVGRLAASAYRTGGQLGTLSILFEAADDVDLVAITEALKTATRSQGEVYSRWITVVEEAEEAAAAAEAAVLDREAAEVAAAEAREDAEAALKEQSEAIEAAEAEREELIQQLAEARGTTADLERKRQEGIEAEEQARREQEALEAAEQKAAEEAAAEEAAAQEAAEQAAADAAAEQEDDASPEPEPDPEPEPEPEPEPPADSSAADRAVAFAYDQLGKPYEWAADGPDSFDCSGLTMRAWEQGGVSLAHWSVDQARTTTRVSYADIQKGDLIFWSNNGEPSGTYHVAIYVGDGKMIQAPATGKNVEIQEVFYWETPSFYGRVQT